MPGNVPADRLIKNLEANIKEHPRDAMAYYWLGRAHLLVLERKSSMIPAWPERGDRLETPAEGRWAKIDGWIPEKDREKAAITDEKELIAHLAGAVTALNKAIELDRGNPAYHLTLACALEAGAPFKDKVDVYPTCPNEAKNAQSLAGKVADLKKAVDAIESDPKAKDTVADALKWTDMPAGRAAAAFTLRDVAVTLLYQRRDDPAAQPIIRELLSLDWRTRTAAEFFAAMELGWPKDKGVTQKPIWGGLGQYVSYEAAQGVVRVSATDETDAGQRRVALANDILKHFNDLPHPGGITPIVLSLEPSSSLADLTASDRTVSFDLDGSGRSMTWPWLKPSTGLLCWDPTNSGRINSGRQLFGSVSWWLFFRNGYEALDALDDNRDGSLAGPELRGISIWFDRNSNAISDAGEVTPIQSLGIAAISCRATATSDGCPANPTGLTLADGRSLPTYDWIAEPITASESDAPGPRSLTPLAIAAIALFTPLALRRRHA